MEYRKHPENILNHLLSMFFIYPMIVPLVILDFFLEIYHNIGFRLYNIPLVDRSKYIKIDRYKLPYLSPIAKMNCAYCGYANGLLTYATRIAADTEAYWCGIKHQAGNGYIELPHHRHFLVYGDDLAFRQLSSDEKEALCKMSK